MTTPVTMKYQCWWEIGFGKIQALTHMIGKKCLQIYDDAAAEDLTLITSAVFPHGLSVCCIKVAEAQAAGDVWAWTRELQQPCLTRFMMRMSLLVASCGIRRNRCVRRGPLSALR